MKEVFRNLFVCNQVDYENSVLPESEYSIVLAAKEPFHRSALGYTGRAASKLDPEYLIARRDNKLILNLVDAPKAEFFNKDIIDTALYFIEDELLDGKKVVIVCNKGESRSASIAMLFLIKNGTLDFDNFVDIEAKFMSIYPPYNPGDGMRGFVLENWEKYSIPF